MPDDLPVDVLTELGRVTWAAIKLEDYTEGPMLAHRTDESEDRQAAGQSEDQGRKKSADGLAELDST
jgi:hypothetical protein